MKGFSVLRIATLSLLSATVASSGVLIGEQGLMEELELFAKSDNNDDPLAACVQLKEVCETQGTLCKAYAALCVGAGPAASDGGPPLPAGADLSPDEQCQQKQRICASLSQSCQAGGEAADLFC